MPRPSALAFRVALLPQSRTGLLRGVNLDVCSFPADSRNSIKTKQVLLIDWRMVIKLPRYDYDEIIDALEGEEDDAADSDAGEDYELVG